MALTVGELRKALEGVDDDIEVVINENYEYTHWLAKETSIGLTDGSNYTSPMSDKDLDVLIIPYAEDKEYERARYSMKVFTLLTI